jgi:hypothetical protein
MSDAERIGVWFNGVAPALVLVALIARDRWRRCWSFCLYLAAVAVANLGVASLAGPIDWTTWVAAEVVQGTLVMAVALEVTARVFGTLPRARAVARLAMLAAVGVALAIVATGRVAEARSLGHLAGELVPRFDLAATLLFLALLAAAHHYSLPLDDLHAAIAFGLSAYTGLAAAAVHALAAVGDEAMSCHQFVKTHRGSENPSRVSALVKPPGRPGGRSGCPRAVRLAYASRGPGGDARGCTVAATR